MIFGHIEIFVKDPLKSKDIYCDILGFQIKDIQQNKYVWLKNDQIELLLRPKNKDIKIDSYQDTNIALVFYTDNLNETVNELRSKGVIFKGTDLSEKCLTFTDPDGNWFQLVNPNDH